MINLKLNNLFKHDNITKLKLYLIFTLIILFEIVKCSLVGIDLGNDSTKVALIRPGRGIEMILNSHSQRKTATAVSFITSTPSLIRLFGEDSLGSVIRNPSKTLLHIPSFLGICSSLYRNKNEYNSDVYHPNGLRKDLYPYLIEDNNAHSGIAINVDGHSMIPEEFTGHYLDFIRRMAEGSIIKDNTHDKGLGKNKRNYSDPGPIFGSETVGAVIAVPPTFTQRQRQSLVDSSEIAGLNLFGLVNSLGAAAVHQSTDLKSDQKSTFLYYDMGAKHISSCIVDFFPKNITHMGRNVQTHVINVLGCHTDYNSGGYLADISIVDSMLDRIRNSPKNSKLSEIPLDNSRVLQKLFKQSVRTKLLLSTLKQTDFFVESLYKDIDMSQAISRDELDKSIEDSIVSRSLKPIEESLKLSNKTINDITDIELLGGGLRIPKIKSVLEKYFTSFGKNIRQRLNGDEAMAFGAAFIAANQSATFRTKNIFYNEASSNEYSIKIGNESTVFIDNSTQFHGVHRLNFQFKEDFTAILNENDKPITQYNISGVSKYLSTHDGNNDSQLNVTLQIRVNTYGIVDLESVYAWKLVNQTIKVPVVVPINTTLSSNGTNDIGGNSTDQANEIINKKNDTKTIFEEKTILKPFPFALDFTEVEIACPKPLNKEEKQSISRHLNELNKLDTKHRQLMDSKNTLESLIYDNRNKLYEDIYIKVTLESEREELNSLLSKTEDWLYEVGDGILLETVEEKIQKIKNLTDVIDLKADEYKYRDELISNVDKKLNSTIELFNSISFTHTWVQNTTFDEVRTILNEFQNWYNDTKAKQQSLKETDVPVLLREETLQKLDFLHSNVVRVRNIPKPRPKIKAKAQKDNKNETENIKEYNTNNTLNDSFNNTDSYIKINDTDIGFEFNQNLTENDNLNFNSSNKTQHINQEFNSSELRDKSEL
ncbi:HSP protein [Cryptosporidium ryanae]|uniref:HSP protein n=1 Tax=Cryptosporidium ryanae TaxID=515981 RepID=UPI00351A2E6C|nr:HSP protein [Cryptosporidium ryanae]